VAPQDVLRDVRERPQRYTPWFRIVLERVVGEMK
jgi:isopentenyldiphosphate isomerase